SSRSNSGGLQEALRRHCFQEVNRCCDQYSATLPNSYSSHEGTSRRQVGRLEGLVSEAAGALEEALQMVDGLLSLESRFPDPPSDADAKVVRGLRGGAAVLMVAAFEEFMRSAIRDHLTP